ncbi:MAG: hypothetical protein KAH23_09425 [Kiritimatiellae bacterium]|nr:hypothetical protein [Kiritimatiellia bacterium]
MYDDLLSGPLFILELLNPQPLMHLDLMEIKGLMNLCAMPLIGILTYQAIKPLGFSKNSATTLAVCSGLMTGVFVPPKIMVMVAVQYAILARILDGFLFGAAVGEIYLKTKTRFFSASPLLLLGANAGPLLSLAGLILIGRSCFRLFKTFVFHPALATVLAATCVAGIIAVPSIQTQSWAILYALLFPSASIAGVIAASKLEKT